MTIDEFEKRVAETIADTKPAKVAGGKERAMTNYNERLDTILAEHREWMRGIRTDRLVGTSSEATKQAITSLIKELVAEAKPELRPTHIPTHGENTARLNAVWNMAIARYKQNLLKGLEEV